MEGILKINFQLRWFHLRIMELNHLWGPNQTITSKTNRKMILTTVVNWTENKVILVIRWPKRWWTSQAESSTFLKDKDSMKTPPKKLSQWGSLGCRRETVGDWALKWGMHLWGRMEQVRWMKEVHAATPLTTQSWPNQSSKKPARYLPQSIKTIISTSTHFSQFPKLTNRLKWTIVFT